MFVRRLVDPEREIHRCTQQLRYLVKVDASRYLIDMWLDRLFIALASREREPAS